MNKNISDLNLHDSKISCLWNKSILELSISTFLDGDDVQGRNYVLMFAGVELVNISQKSPWGHQTLYCG